MAEEMFPRFSFSPDDDIIARTRWYIHFRWFYILILAVPTGLSTFFSYGWSGQLMTIVSAGALGLITNGIVYASTHFFSRARHFQMLAAMLLMSDIMINNYIVFTRGGIESRSFILYVIPIIMSAIILGRKGIYIAATLSLLSYNVIIVADFLNIFRSEGTVSPGIQTQLPVIVYTAIFFSAALVAIAVSMDFIVKLLRQKERRALETTEDLKAAQTVGRFGSWEWDIKKDQVAWSDEMYRLLGLNGTVDDLTVERYVDFVHPKDRRNVVTAINKASKRPQRFSIDYRIVRDDGSEIHISSEGQSLAEKSGKVGKIVATARDVTEERILDQSKNEFVSLASHQLRTPATVVKQYLGMLLDGYAGELTDKQRTFLKVASDTNEHQINIVNTLLGVAQLESGKIQLSMTQVDLVPFLRSLVEEYAPRARVKNQTLSFSTRYKSLYCHADEHALRTVFENIVDNAFKYSLPGKSVLVRLAKESKTAVVSVADQGIGIAGHDLSKLFKKFSRIDSPETFHEDGAGLGLYWAEKIVSLHRGKISVESEPGKGAVFKVSLPAKRKSVRQSSTKRPKARYST